MKSLPATLFFLTIPLLLYGQQPGPSPVFRSSSHLVQLNVIVQERNGQPIRDLQKDDFVISDRGKAQQIRVFSLDEAERAGESAERLPANTFSDEAKYHGSVAPNVTLILLDNLNTLSTTSADVYEDSPIWLEAMALGRAKKNLLEYLGSLGPHQRIALYGLSDTLHVLCDFTCSRDELLAVVKSYDTTSHTRRVDVEPGQYRVPENPYGANINRYTTQQAREMAAMNNQARAQVTMAALNAIAAHLADVPGRKNLLWLTGNLPFSAEAIARVLSPAGISAYPVDARGLLPHELGENIEGYIDADAYALGELGTPAPHAQPTGIDTMQHMAEETGGRAFVNTNDLTGAIRKAVEDATVSYTLGYYIEPGWVDGKYHEVHVQVRRPGAVVRQPKGYFAVKDEAASEDDRRRNFAAAVKSPVEFSAIPLTLKVERLNQPKPGVLQLAGSVGIGNLGLPQATAGTHSGALDIYVLEQDAAGNVLHQSANRIALKLTPEQYAAYLKSGISFQKSVQPSEGTAVLRVVVQDPSSAAVGSVLISLAQLK